MRLVHFTSDSSWRYSPDALAGDRSDGYRMAGLSLSDEDSTMSWSRWCRKEGFRVEDLGFSHEVKLRENHDVLIIRTWNEMTGFIWEFAIDIGHGLTITNWGRVAEKWRGYVITPEGEWPKPWDYASGCIWSPEAIESVTPVVLSQEAA